MDGDTLLSEGSLARSCAILTSEPRVGAVTTDNVPLVSGSAFTREWYRVRMAHRDSLMASMSLSRKLLVLTGRFSVFKAEIAVTNSFINAVRQDFVDHGRLGRIRMVTGDDKSTWFETLRKGWDMLYVPDVVVHPVEELPAGGFFSASTALMVRWYGNMVRNNGRALGLGPGRCGWFPWLCLADQRYSMWTSLIGPSTALIARDDAERVVPHRLSDLGAGQPCRGLRPLLDRDGSLPPALHRHLVLQPGRRGCDQDLRVLPPRPSAMDAPDRGNAEDSARASARPCRRPSWRPRSGSSCSSRASWPARSTSVSGWSARRG